jgi:hypothetical protein
MSHLLKQICFLLNSVAVLPCKNTVCEYVYTGVRKKEPGRTLWGKWFVRDDALVVRGTAQLVHETVSLGFE